MVFHIQAAFELLDDCVVDVGGGGILFTYNGLRINLETIGSLYECIEGVG